MAVLQDININVHGQPSEKRLQTFLRLSQNENGRMINFRVLGPPLPSNCTATFSGTKPDGNVYSKTGTVAGNFVVIQEDMQMTAVAGVWDAKLDIINGSHNIMTALIRVVIDADVVDPDAIASDSQLQGLVAEAKYYAEHARTDAYGSPLTAPTKAQMTDHTRVYVYTGSEPNMVAGNWYYWNGTAWISGGVYNSVAVQSDSELNDLSTNPVQNKVIKAALDQIEGAIPEIDATLSVAGKAADAKKTGDEISGLKEDLNAKPSTLTPDDATAADLYICDANGNVLAKFEDGHIVTKNFTSESIGNLADLSTEAKSNIVEAINEAAQSGGSEEIIKEASKTEADLYICDSFGNVIAELKNGHIVTKEFDSSNVEPELSEMSERITTNATNIGNIKRIRTRMCFGAHNGAEWYAPECTIPAYRIAGQQGWEWAWIAGIYFSSEGSMYVLHDGTVDRTTDGTGSVSSMTDAQIDALNITQTGAGYNLSDFDPSELKIPTFEQVVQQCVKYGMKMVIRLSNFPNGTDTAENEAKWDNFLEVINGYGVQPEDISCYLDTGTKAGTCRSLIGDNVEISTHLGTSATASDFVDWFESRSITGKKAAILSYQNTNLEAVKLLHSHGIRVYSYGYNSQAQADNCALWGVDIYQNGRIYKITD